MKTSKLVEKILSESQSARDSDKVLIKKFLEANGIYLNSQQLATMMGINFESIRRVRQALQNTKGLYPASPEVAKQRKLKSQVIEQNIPTTKPDEVAELIEKHVEKYPTAVSWMKDE